MTKDQLTAAISGLEQSIEGLDRWTLFFAALVAIGVVGEAVLGVRHWLLDRRLTSLRHEETQIHERELAELQRDTAEANRKAEEEKLARAKIEEKIAPRRLSVEQKESMQAYLRKVPDIRVALTSRLFDSEGADFGTDLANVLESSGWKVLFNDHQWTRLDRGVFVGTVNRERLPGLAELDEALTKIGIAHSIIELRSDDHTIPNPGFQPGAIYILVGGKP